MGAHDRAIADLGLAIQLAPDGFWILADRAKVYELKGDHGRAIDDYIRAMRAAHPAKSSIAEYHEERSRLQGMTGQHGLPRRDDAHRRFWKLLKRITG